MATASVDIEAARGPGSGLTAVRLRRSSDAVLVRRASRGDRQAFGAIFERYSDPLYRYCVSILGNPEDASDALQATMESALKAMEAGAGSPRQLKPWLFRIAHNESISLVRRRRPEVTLEHLELEGRGTTEERVALRARIQALFSDLRDLPEAQRGSLLMRELSGLGYDEIASALSISAAAAKQAVYEARVALHEIEEGRNMLCADARAAISDGDGRRLRGRRVRAHLRSCADCAAFRDVLGARQADLAAIPPLGAVAGASLLASILGGGGSGGAGGSGVLFSGGIGSVVTAKGAAVVAAGAIVAGGAGIELSRSDPVRGDDARPGAVPIAAHGEKAAHAQDKRTGAAAPGRRKADRKTAMKRNRESARRDRKDSLEPNALDPVAQSPGKNPGGDQGGAVVPGAHPGKTGLAIADHVKKDDDRGQGAGNAADGLQAADGARDGAGTQASSDPPAPPLPAGAQNGSSSGSSKKIAESVAGALNPGRRPDRGAER